MSVTPQSDIYNIDSEMSRQADSASQTEKIRSPLASIFVYIMKQSYVSTLILMMVSTAFECVLYMAAHFLDLDQDCNFTVSHHPALLSHDLMYFLNIGLH